MSGKVWLVGAGPGDPELLTLKAVKALRGAQVILCDDLVHDDVLAYANPAARVVRVGKRGGKASTSQKFIVRLMIAEARSGLAVVRLKGGDPMIFLKKFPGRVASVHVKPYSKAKPNALIGDDEQPWKEIFQLCETSAGVEWYIIEYEKDAYAPLVSVQKTLEVMKRWGKC